MLDFLRAGAGLPMDRGFQRILMAVVLMHVFLCALVGWHVGENHQPSRTERHGFKIPKDGGKLNAFCSPEPRTVGSSAKRTGLPARCGLVWRAELALPELPS